MKRMQIENQLGFQRRFYSLRYRLYIKYNINNINETGMGTWFLFDNIVRVLCGDLSAKR